MDHVPYLLVVLVACFVQIVEAQERVGDTLHNLSSSGPGSPKGVLLLHGLMGRAAHWAGTARWLSGRYRAVALDQRGHGRSDSPVHL